MYTQLQLNNARHLVYEYTGISLSDNKDVMIANRLDKLRRALCSDNIDEILSTIKRGENKDIFVNTFTTNKTSFFREDFHFDDLKNRVIKESAAKGDTLKMYCSAASTGEEPYSILMTTEEAKRLYGATYLNYSLLATDIDTSVLEQCRNGIYEWSKIADDFPSWIKPQDYLQRRAHPQKPNEYQVRVKKELQSKVAFKPFNLMSPSYPFKHGEFDVIFCRNVLIYFDQKDQNTILKKLFKSLKLNGTLYLGHSESPLELTPFVQRYGQNIFVKIKECE